MERSSNPLGLLWGHSPQREELQTSGIVMGTQPSGRGSLLPPGVPLWGRRSRDQGSKPPGSLWEHNPQAAGLHPTGILMGTQPQGSGLQPPGLFMGPHSPGSGLQPAALSPPHSPSLRTGPPAPTHRLLGSGPGPGAGAAPQPALHRRAAASEQRQPAPCSVTSSAPGVGLRPHSAP